MLVRDLPHIIFSNLFTGPYCEKCETCRHPCEKLRACVECVFFKDSSRLQKESENEVDVLYLDKVKEWFENSHANDSCPCEFQEHPYSNDTGWQSCTYKYMDCKYTFSYRYGINYDKVLYCVDYNGWQKELNKCLIFSKSFSVGSQH